MNIDRPDANREAYVFVVEKLEGTTNKNEKFSGYFIVIPVDIRWVLSDKSVECYKARVFTQNQILITMPSWDYDLLHNRDEFVGLSPAADENLVDAMDDARHTFNDNRETRRFKHIMLDFPSDNVLSSKTINKNAGDDEILKLRLFFSKKLLKRGDIDSGDEYSVKHYAGWSVARLDITPRKSGKVEPKENKSDIAAQLESLGLVDMNEG